LATIKTSAAFDSSVQPLLDRNRIRALPSLGFVEKYAVVHFIG
jgi:hypothetical protein